MMRVKFLQAFLVFIVLGLSLTTLSGCGSSGPVSSSSPEGTGYRITLTASHHEPLYNDGSVGLQAVVFAPDGSPAEDDTDGVLFAASLKGTFNGTTNDRAAIKGGVAMTSYTWTDESSKDNPDPSQTLLITASYRGAVATLELEVSSNSF